MEALDENTEDEGIAGEKGFKEAALYLSQSEDYFYRKSKQRQSFRSSMVTGDSSTVGFDLLDRPTTWTEGQPAGDTRQLFINLLKRWANCEAPDSLKAQLPVRQPVVAQVSRDEPSLASPLTTVPDLVQESRPPVQKLPIETYIKAQIKTFEENHDEEQELKLDLSHRSLKLVPQEVVDFGSEVSMSVRHRALSTPTREAFNDSVN